MVYKQKGRRYYNVQFNDGGKLIFRRTRCSTKRAAEEEERELKLQFAREKREKEEAATRLGCIPQALLYCPECSKLFRADRALLGLDGTPLCSSPCRTTWDKKCRPSPALKVFLDKDFLPFVRTTFKATRKSRKYYEYGSDLLKQADFAALSIDQLTNQHAAHFAAQHSTLSASTINCALRTLRRACNLAFEWARIEKPIRITLATGERHRERIVTEAEFAAYAERCRQPWRDIAELIFAEGFRPNECYCLDWEHVAINETGGVIKIVRGKTKAARRQLPMLPAVHEALFRRWEAAGRPKKGWVFPAPIGTKSGHFEQDSAKNQHIEAINKLDAAHKAHKTWSAVRGEWAKVVADAAGVDRGFVLRHQDVIRAGVKRFEPYCLRHSALTRLGENGCDVFTLAKIAGHSSIAITQRYVHPQAEAIERAFAKIGTPAALPAKEAAAERGEIVVMPPQHTAAN